MYPRTARVRSARVEQRSARHSRASTNARVKFHGKATLARRKVDDKKRKKKKTQKCLSAPLKKENRGKRNIRIYLGCAFDRTTGRGCTVETGTWTAFVPENEDVSFSMFASAAAWKPVPFCAAQFYLATRSRGPGIPFLRARVLPAFAPPTLLHTRRTVGNFRGDAAERLNEKSRPNGRYSVNKEYPLQLLLGELFIFSFAASCKTEPAFSFIEAEPSGGGSGRFLGDFVDRQSAYGFNYAGLSTLWLRSSPITAVVLRAELRQRLKRNLTKARWNRGARRGGMQQAGKNRGGERRRERSFHVRWL